MRTPKLADQVQLQLQWNTCLLFNSDIVNFAWKTNEGEAESIDWLIFCLWRCFNCWWVRYSRVGQKFYLGPAEITFFFSWVSEAISMTHSGMLYRLDISKFYFYEPYCRFKFNLTVKHRSYFF